MIHLQAYIVDIHEVFGRVGNIQARNRTGHGKIDKQNVCRAHEKIYLTGNLSICISNEDICILALIPVSQQQVHVLLI